ncbi:MAG: hypothetical protein R2857_02250 [Vampirovibrionales bacterium]
MPVKSRQKTRFSGIYELSHNASDGFLRTLQRAEEAEPKPVNLFQWLGRLRGKQVRQQKRLGLVYSVLADGMQAQLNDQAMGGFSPTLSGSARGGRYSRGRNAARYRIDSTGLRQIDGCAG